MATAGSDVTYVSGHITSTQAGVIDHVFSTASSGDVLAPGAGDYTLRLENASGGEIVAYSFAPETNVEAGTLGGATLDFVLALPYRLDGQSAVRALVLLYNGQELDRVAASANAPVISGDSITSSIAAITSTWAASGTDGDSLEYVLTYSPDGATWHDASAGAMTGSQGQVTLALGPQRGAGHR